ncbi:polyprotein [Elysia marginata]|uniref:Polyprotein n=1 Tax=Elysia marginata TaxID=1093978 RepID=A0AAV4E9N9_9GAST|nr:polyprotein [Elysia marginata]
MDGCLCDVKDHSIRYYFHLRSVFTTHGLPDTIVSDNGPTFTSQEFQDFMRYNNIHHTRTAPYHPSSNGLAERAVATYISSLRKMTRGTVHEKANRFLFKYHTTPHSTSGVTPAELMFNRKIKTRLDMINDSVARNVAKSQMNQKLYHDKHSKAREITVQDPVLVKNFTSSHPKYIPGEVVKLTGPESFQVQSNQGVKRYHVDQMHTSRLDGPIADQVHDEQTPPSEPFHIAQSPLAFEQDRQVPQNQHDRDGTFPTGGGGEETEGLKQLDSTEEPEQLRLSTRTRKAPQKLNL